ncbi:MAG: type IV pilus assembly protein PilM [Planctomycetota bacterium]|nr:MAG: type IV pilus assembly protein PilM [Planctomycetota bacterium]
MASPQTVWGIDMGRCALKALRLRMTDDRVEVVAHEHIEHEKILTQPDADRGELIRSALEKLLSRHDLSKDDVVVSVPGQHTLARFTKLPPVAKKRIPDIVRYEADQQIPFDMDEIIWDYQTFQEEGAPDLEVGIFAMKRELIREHLLYFEQASIEPVAVQTGPLAVYNAAHFDGLLGDETTVLLDVGAENTDLIIATKDTFWTRTVPIGGNNFTEALVKSFKLSFAKAESLKRTADSSKYARQIFQAMRPVFADLVQELQRSFGFYSSTRGGVKLERVICMGNAFKLPGLRKYLQQNLGIPVERLDTFRKASGGGAELKRELLSFGVAYGLAVQGLGKAAVNSNLLPTEIAKQAAWRKKRPFFAAAAACVLLAGGIVWFRQMADMRALAAGARDVAPTVNDVESAMRIIESGPSPALSDRAQAQAILNAGQFLKKKLSELSGQGERERRDTEELIAVQQSKAIVPRILRAVHDALPPLPDGLADVHDPKAFAQAVARLGPRGKRQIVTLHELFMQYEEDVNAYEWKSLTPAPEPINDPESELPAMKLEIVCRTPYQGEENGPYKTATEFISETFMKNLRKTGRKAGLGFYFDRVYLNFGGRVDLTGVRVAGGAGGRGGRFGRGGGGGEVVTTKVDPKTLDPVTNEKMTDDWEFEIWVDVIIGEDFPAQEEQGGEG